jgi:hypothetical protein
METINNLKIKELPILKKQEEDENGCLWKVMMHYYLCLKLQK